MTVVLNDPEVILQKAAQMLGVPAADRRTPADYPIPKLVDLWNDQYGMKGVLEVAARAVSVYRNTGPWDGGVTLKQAMKELQEALDPFVVKQELVLLREQRAG